MKTPLQICIDEIKKRITHYSGMPYSNDIQKASHEYHLYGLNEAVKVLEIALHHEKQVIIKHSFDFYYDHSRQMKCPEHCVSENRFHAEEYFDKNFNQEQ